MVCNVSLMYLILKYLKSKPLAQQTVMDSANAFLIKMGIAAGTLGRVLLFISRYLGMSIPHEIAVVFSWTNYNLYLCMIMGCVANALLQALVVWTTCKGYSEPSEKLIKMI